MIRVQGRERTSSVMERVRAVALILPSKRSVASKDGDRKEGNVGISSMSHETAKSRVNASEEQSKDSLRSRRIPTLLTMVPRSAMRMIGVVESWYCLPSIFSTTPTEEAEDESEEEKGPDDDREEDGEQASLHGVGVEGVRAGGRSSEH